MDSPVSLRALGECNAIRKRGFGHTELTFASTQKPRSAIGAICRRSARLTADQPSTPQSTHEFRILDRQVCKECASSCDGTRAARPAKGLERA
jgi:hypothetical protein